MDELLNYVTQLIDYIEANGANLNAETQQELAVFLQEVMQFIAEFQQPVEGLPASQPITELQQSMPSSNIFGFNYDYDNGKLLVKFQGNDGVGQGPLYQFEGVQPYIFNLFKKGAAIAKTTGSNKWGKWWKGKSPSIGSAFYSFIRQGNYPYQKLS